MGQTITPPTSRDVRHQARRVLDEARLIEPPAADLKPADRLRWFADVDQAAKDAGAAAELLKKRRDAYHEQVLSALDAMGLQRAPLTDGPTIYRTRELWAGYDYPDDADADDKARVKEHANKALRAAGLDEYVVEGFNAQSLSAYFRDRERELEAEIRERDGLPADAPVAVDPDDLIPTELAGLVRVTEKIYPKAKTS